MADTRPIVHWALEMRCALRVGENARLPGKGAEALWIAQQIHEALGTKVGTEPIVGDVFVYDTTQKIVPGNPTGQRWREYPSKGCVISEVFKDVEGGLAGVWNMCRGCVANVGPGYLGGCDGILSLWPGDQRVVEIVSQTELTHEMAAAFPQTKPIWHGLWAISPVPRKSLPVLRRLMTELERTAGNQDRDELNLFILAIDLSLRRNLNLHVKLGAPGHTDFGLLTIFPHCPFCKAEANVERWQRRYPAELQTCEVCGTRFSPAETAKTIRDDYDRDDLRTILGPERFAQFAVQYLVANGASQSEAEAIMVETERTHWERMEKLRLERERANQERRFVSEVVLAGLPRVPAPPSDFPEDDPEGAAKRTPLDWFDGDTMAEAIRRCLRKDIQVGILMHESIDEDFVRYEAQKVISNPLELLAKWRSEGCNEKFNARFRVPEGMGLA